MKTDLSAVFVQDPIDLLYFTGLKLSAGKLLVHSREAVLLVDGRYLQSAREQFAGSVLTDRPESWSLFCAENHLRRIGFDGRHVSHDQYMSLLQAQKTSKTGIELVPSTPFFKTLRSIKDPQEIAAMKKSAALLWKGYQFLEHSLKKGITEKDLSRRLHIFSLENGADGLSFDPIIAFGANSAMPHYRAGDNALKNGDTVLIDIGVVVGGYHSDMTRVLFFGKGDPYMRHLYETVQKAQQRAIRDCRPGITLRKIDQAARSVLQAESVEHLFVHNLGHGIGLECHEFPRINSDGEDKDVKLKSGMVITIEPGLYVPGKGGVRYEDTIVITPRGPLNLYPGF